MKHMIFGESHGPAIGVVLEGVKSGLVIDMEFITREMDRRKPGQNDLSTPRKEADSVKVLSGVFEGRATGTPLCGIIENSDTRSRDYEAMKVLARPGHADYSGFVRYQGFNDHRGSGHFSGRITAPLVFAGAVAKLMLKESGVTVRARIREIAGIEDVPSRLTEADPSLLDGVADKGFPVIDDAQGELMKEAIRKVKDEHDSVGGIIECVIDGLPAGKGTPGRDSVESILSLNMFAVPAVKGIEFGTGFGMASMKGSQANDQFQYRDGKVVTTTNNNGGINGGITNGMPVVFSVVIKPTSSIGLPQKTMNMKTLEDSEIAIEGRHDPCIVHRAVPVIEAAAALAICEVLGL
ncbi:MAG: chorismate synthase [Youngiibacter sp.]|nr:chorismate synthase [Youngiibacter sp.]